MKAFGITVHTDQAQKKEGSGNNHMVYSVDVEGRPEVVTLHITAEKEDGVTPVAVYETQPFEYPDQLSFDLKVPVSWRQVKVGKDDVWVPHTRQGEKDFMNVILVNSQLHFTDVQISLLSRKGRFYIFVQLVYEGWMRIGEDKVRFIPGKPAFAYPGANYQETWRGRGSVLAAMTRIVEGVLEALKASLEAPTPAVWRTQDPIKFLDGWKGGQVLFFCPITNTGHVIGEDGTTYHLWGNNLMGVEGPVHILEPMAPVHFRPGKQEEGQAFPSVKSCKPA